MFPLLNYQPHILLVGLILIAGLLGGGCSSDQGQQLAEMRQMRDQLGILTVLVGACWAVMAILSMSLGMTMRKLFRRGADV